MTEKRSYADIEAEFNEALRLRDAGSVAEAEAILLRLAQLRPDAGVVFGMLGHVQEQLGRSAEAAKSYRRATNLSPRSELASVSLFHVLYEQGDLEGAFDEMRRFRRRRRSSPEYDRLISDLKLSVPDEPGGVER
jgi:predicted Zn-dependent protease